MSERKLTAEQLEELQSGDGYYYVSQGMAGHAGEWPAVVKHPKDRMLRLVRRQAKEVQSKGETHIGRSPEPVMIARTWEYGAEINAKVERIVTNHPHTVVLTDEHGEGHILIGTSCVRAGICEGDEVTLVFMQGGPTGGYWQIKPAIEWTPCPKCGYPLNDCCCS